MTTEVAWRCYDCGGLNEGEPEMKVTTCDVCRRRLHEPIQIEKVYTLVERDLP